MPLFLCVGAKNRPWCASSRALGLRAPGTPSPAMRVFAFTASRSRTTSRSLCSLSSITVRACWLSRAICARLRPRSRRGQRCPVALSGRALFVAREEGVVAARQRSQQLSELKHALNGARPTRVHEYRGPTIAAAEGCGPGWPVQRSPSFLPCRPHPQAKRQRAIHARSPCALSHPAIASTEKPSRSRF